MHLVDSWPYYRERSIGALRESCILCSVGGHHVHEGIRAAASYAINSYFRCRQQFRRFRYVCKDHEEESTKIGRKLPWCRRPYNFGWRTLNQVLPTSGVRILTSLDLPHFQRTILEYISTIVVYLPIDPITSNFHKFTIY